jgi:hypothetical protein
MTLQKPMIPVYHGSNTTINNINLSKCQPGRDFGRGFYVTKIMEQAGRMAERIAAKKGGKPEITGFLFNNDIWETPGYNTARFKEYNKSWLEFIIKNRLNRKQQNIHNFDLVEGPVADDKINTRIDNYLEGEIPLGQFLKELTFFKPTNQICLCTQKSLHALKTKIREKPAPWEIMLEKIKANMPKKQALIETIMEHNAQYCDQQKRSSPTSHNNPMPQKEPPETQHHNDFHMDI